MNKKKGVIIVAFIFLILIILFKINININYLLINTLPFATKFLLPWIFLYWFIKFVNVLEKQIKIK